MGEPTADIRGPDGCRGRAIEDIKCTLTADLLAVVVGPLGPTLELDRLAAGFPGTAPAPDVFADGAGEGE